MADCEGGLHTTEHRLREEVKCRHITFKVHPFASKLIAALLEGQ